MLKEKKFLKHKKTCQNLVSSEERENELMFSNYPEFKIVRYQLETLPKIRTLNVHEKCFK